MLLIEKYSGIIDRRSDEQVECMALLSIGPDECHGVVITRRNTNVAARMPGQQ